MSALSIHDEPGLPPRHKQGDGGGLHVQPRIQALERRMLQQQQQQQLRNTPEQPQRRCGNTSHTPSNAQYYSDSEEEEDIHIHSTPTTMMTIAKDYPTTTATPNFEHRNKENTNHTPATTTTTTALVLHSPILASIYNSNIKQFEADVLKRQAEYTNRISDLEGRLALFHSRLAMECAERGREQAFTVEVRGCSGVVKYYFCFSCANNMVLTMNWRYSNIGLTAIYYYHRNI